MSLSLVAQSPVMTPAQKQGPAEAVYPLTDAMLQWPLAPSDTAYGVIDGRHLQDVVRDLTAISRRYRDAGHPQFWGRIIGTSADQESQRYLVDRFRRIGLTDIRIQSFDLMPQWMAESWEITAGGAGKTLALTTAQPAYATAATSAEGLNVEAIWVGTGSDADYLGRDVSGKAVFIARGPRTNPAQAKARGAAALVIMNELPGNVRTQTYPLDTGLPTFLVGMDDALAVRDLIAEAAPEGVHVKIRLNASMVSGLKTATVWGTLPGATEETIYVLAHRDGWFEGASDNASGVATMVGLAEYFARIPRIRRRRSIVFLGSSGHHNSTDTAGFATSPSNMTGSWLLENRETLFAKTALFINCEHTSTLLTFVQGASNRVRRINTSTGLQWYAGGPARPRLQDLSVKAFRDFGVATYAEPERNAPNGEAGGLWPYIPVVQVSDYGTYFHTDRDTEENVSWTGLESVTRAYAKIIDRVNELELTDLQRAPEAGGTPVR